MARQPEETARDWLIRATKDHAEALNDLQVNADRLGLGEPILPGYRFPLVHDDAYDAAHERVAQTEAEMNDAADVVHREIGSL